MDVSWLGLAIRQELVPSPSVCMTLHGASRPGSLQGRTIDSQSGLLTAARSPYNSNGGIYRISADGSGTPSFVFQLGYTDLIGLLTDASFPSAATKVLYRWRCGRRLPMICWNLGPGAEAQLSPDANWMAFISQDGLVVQQFPQAHKARADRGLRLITAALEQKRPSTFLHHLGQETDGRRLRFRNGKSKRLARGLADSDHCQCVHRVSV